MMRSLNDHSPLAVVIYYSAVASVLMFSMNVVLAATALAGSLTYHFVSSRNIRVKNELWLALFFLLMVIINPVISHKGSTVLFVINDSPVTLESFYYGVTAAAIIISVLCFFRSMTRILTSDKLQSLFGIFSPKLALILSMSLRFIPMFARQAAKIDKSQKALGLYKEENPIDFIKAKARIFSALVTWALENGIITANSMNARGYGSGRRTRFNMYKSDLVDLVFILLTLALLSPVIAGMICGALDISFYPLFVMREPGVLSYISYLSYGALVFAPTILEIRESLKWKYLQSKI